MKQSTFFQRFGRELSDNAWIFALLVGLFLQVNIRYFVFVRQGIYLGESIITTMSTLFWALLPPIMLSAFVSFAQETTLRYIIFRRFIKFVVWLWIAYCFFAFIVDNYVLSAYNSVFTDSIAINILGTNPSEAGEFISAAPWSFVLYPALILLVWLVVCWRTKRRIARIVQKLFQRKEQLVTSLFLIVPIFPCMVFFPAQMRMYAQGKPSFAYMVSHERIIQGIACCLKQAEEVRRGVERLAKIDLGIVKSDHRFEKVNILLIMGESLRRDYMHCYGYPVKNTPHLDSLVTSGELILFSDVVAPAPYTVSSIVENLTFHQVHEDKPWYEYPTIFQVLSRGDITPIG